MRPELVVFKNWAVYQTSKSRQRNIKQAFKKERKQIKQSNTLSIDHYIIARPEATIFYNF